MIEHRKELDPPTKSHTFIGGSAFETNWFDQIDTLKYDKIIILAEGLLMYFKVEDTIQLLHAIKNKITECIIIFDVAGATSNDQAKTQKLGA